MPLQCPVCSRNGFKRLTRHLKQAHSLSKPEALARYPGLVFEEPLPSREIPCSSCGEIVPGVSPRATYVKCEKCRVPPYTGPQVSCALCGISRRSLRNHLRASHELTPDQYRAKYPGEPVEVPGIRKKSPETRTKMSAGATRRWSDPEKRAEQSAKLKQVAPWKGKKLSPEHREAISKAVTGCDYNLSEEGRRIRAECGRRALEKIRQRPGYWERVRKGQKESRARRAREGTLYFPNGRGISGIRKDVGHFTRSTLEANFSRVLLLNKIPYQYEPKCFNLQIGGNTVLYLPDFYLEEPLSHDGRVLVPAGWVELKGWRPKPSDIPWIAQEKIDALSLLVGSSVALVVQSEPSWTDIRDIWRPQIPLWETGRRNLRTNPQMFR